MQDETRRTPPSASTDSDAGSEAAGTGSYADSEAVSLPEVDWSDPVRALNQLYTTVIRQAETSVAWYRVHKHGRRSWAVSLRLMTILLSVAAAVTPVILPLLPDTALRVQLVPLSSVFMVLGAACLALDRFFGFSSSWMRYVSTELELRSRLAAFQLAWSSEQARLRQERPTPAKVEELLQQLRAFAQEVDNVVSLETRVWIEEFRGDLESLEKARETQQQVLKAQNAENWLSGALRVRVEGLEQLDGRQFQLQLGNEPFSQHTANPVVIADLKPGLLRVRLRGLREGQALLVEEVAVIRPGVAAELVVRLPGAEGKG